MAVSTMLAQVSRRSLVQEESAKAVLRAVLEALTMRFECAELGVGLDEFHAALPNHRARSKRHRRIPLHKKKATIIVAQSDATIRGPSRLAASDGLVAQQEGRISARPVCTGS